MLSLIIALTISAVAAGVGFYQAKEFVLRRLRYVDAVLSPAAPIIAAVGASLLALPATILPLISAATVISFGVSVGFGVAAGAREIKHRLPPM